MFETVLFFNFNSKPLMFVLLRFTWWMFVCLWFTCWYLCVHLLIDSPTRGAWLGHLCSWNLQPLVSLYLIFLFYLYLIFLFSLYLIFLFSLYLIFSFLSSLARYTAWYVEYKIFSNSKRSRPDPNRMNFHSQSSISKNPPLKIIIQYNICNPQF